MTRAEAESKHWRGLQADLVWCRFERRRAEFVQAVHGGASPLLHYYRDGAGVEVDLVVEHGVPPGQLGLVEIKAGQTFHADWLVPMKRIESWVRARIARRMLVYGGHESFRREGVEVVGLGA